MAMIDEFDPSAFDLLVCSPSPLSRSQLRVDFSSVYDRQPHPDQQLEQTIEKVWEQRITSQPSLFSASKFRYGGFEESASEGTPDKLKVVLRLGLTDYKHFQFRPAMVFELGGTRGLVKDFYWDKPVSRVAKVSDVSIRCGIFLVFRPREASCRVTVHPNNSNFGWVDDAGKCKHTADPLGNGAIVETTDHHILILQRSMNVGEFPGYLVFPGGHSEPDEIGVISHNLMRSVPTSAEVNNKIAEEMFDGVTREIVEETGVSANTLSDPVFIGISRRKMNARPTAFFYVKCSLTSAEVMDVYRNAEHSFESTVLLSSSPDALLEGGPKMPGCHHGGAALYQKMREELARRPTPQ